MIATVFNCITVCIGSVIGLFLHSRLRDDIRDVVYISAGCISLLVGLEMAFESSKVLYLVLSLFFGGVLGTLWDIEGAIVRFGGFLERTCVKPASREKRQGDDFALGFLNASVLFCVGAMTIVGAFKAGAQGDYALLMMKSVMDGFMALMFSAAMGIGVAFSIITILVYQGGLTLLAAYIGPVIGESAIAELSGVGGLLVVMIGINLLGLKEIKTANFLPALLLVLAFSLADPLIQPLVSLLPL